MSDESPAAVLVDDAGHIVGVLLDGAVYRVQTDAKIAKGVSDLVHLDAIDTGAGLGRLKATLYSADGDPVAFPSVSSSIVNDFVKSGGSDNLLVDGSSTPVVFEYLADGTYDISLQEMRFSMAANSITFGTGYFGAVNTPLVNGLLVQVITGGETVDVYNLTRNEDFANFASPGGFQWVVSSKDFLTSAYVIGGGLRLEAGAVDRVKVTVRDNLSAAGVYFKMYVKGNLLTAA